MNDNQTISSIVSVLQVGFAGWVAVYLLTKTNVAINDLNKNMASMLEILSEIRSEMKDQGRTLNNVTKTEGP